MGYTKDGIPFNEGSDTSEAAAESQADKKKTDEGQVLAYLKSRGEQGATDDELGLALGLIHQTVSARRNGLVRRGLVENTGKTRATRTGRAAFVWIHRDVPARVQPPKPSYASLVRALRHAEEEEGLLSVRFDIALKALYGRLPTKGR